MRKAIHEAGKAEKIDEVPIGCVIVKDGKIIARGHNKREKEQLSISHAEINAIRKACKKLKSWRLEDCDLYVTLEPCPMCAGAIIQSRIRHVYFGASDPKGGSVCSCTSLFDVPEYNHHPEYTSGILQEECGDLLSSFFRRKRKLKKKEKAARKLAEQRKEEQKEKLPENQFKENTANTVSDKQADFCADSDSDVNPDLDSGKS